MAKIYDFDKQKVVRATKKNIERLSQIAFVVKNFDQVSDDDIELSNIHKENSLEDLLNWIKNNNYVIVDYASQDVFSIVKRDWNKRKSQWSYYLPKENDPCFFIEKSDFDQYTCTVDTNNFIKNILGVLDLPYIIKNKDIYITPETLEIIESVKKDHTPYVINGTNGKLENDNSIYWFNVYNNWFRSSTPHYYEWLYKNIGFDSCELTTLETKNEK